MTTPTLTQAQQQKAIRLLTSFVTDEWWYWEGPRICCKFCNNSALTFEDMVHENWCTVGQARELLAAIESEEAE
jgi:hypothetical protein